jgi:hypothetical protein
VQKVVGGTDGELKGGNMATWGDFIAEMAVQRSKGGGMVVAVDDAITVWEERNQLRKRVAELEQQLAAEREGCAAEVDEFADAIAAEPEQPEYLVPVLRAAANLIRERGTPEAAEEPAVEPPAEAEEQAAEPEAKEETT